MDDFLLKWFEPNGTLWMRSRLENMLRGCSVARSSVIAEKYNDMKDLLSLSLRIYLKSGIIIRMYCLLHIRQEEQNLPL